MHIQNISESFLKRQLRLYYPFSNCSVPHSYGYFLFVYNFQYVHRTGFCTDSTSDTFCGYRRFLCFYHNTERTGFYALSTSGTQFFINHINTLRILLDRSGFTRFCTFSALYANHRFYGAFFLYDLNTGFVWIKYFIKTHGTGSHTLQTSYTG